MTNYEDKKKKILDHITTLEDPEKEVHNMAKDKLKMILQVYTQAFIELCKKDRNGKIGKYELCEFIDGFVEEFSSKGK